MLSHVDLRLYIASIHRFHSADEEDFYKITNYILFCVIIHPRPGSWIYTQEVRGADHPSFWVFPPGQHGH
ncbi:hypothetical protein PAMP_018931 [Pampus punctatissimus]